MMHGRFVVQLAFSLLTLSRFTYGAITSHLRLCLNIGNSAFNAGECDPMYSYYDIWFVCTCTFFLKKIPWIILDAFWVYFSESSTTGKARKATKGDKIIAAVSFTPSIDLTVIQGIIYLIWLVPGDLDLTWYIRTGRVSSSRAWRFDVIH